MAIDSTLHLRRASPTLIRLRALAGVRWLVGLGYAALFVQQYRSKGFPFDRERVLLWIAGALLITAIGRGSRRAVQVIADWTPFAALLLAYDYSRGSADNLGLPVQIGALVKVEKFFFFGNLPPELVQRAVVPDADAPAQWWELAVSIVYASHFVLPFALAGLLWWRSRRYWRAFVNRFLILSFSAVITYCLMPSGPPWLAAERGLIGPIERPVGRGWSVISLHAAPKLLSQGRAALNPVAALPSLHAGYSFLIALFVWKTIGAGRARLLLFAYPLAMAFTLLYGGEHYVIDIAAGWLYTLAAFALAGRLERYVRSRVRHHGNADSADWAEGHRRSGRRGDRITGS